MRLKFIWPTMKKKGKVAKIFEDQGDFNLFVLGAPYYQGGYIE
jgi:hypothetical protein